MRFRDYLESDIDDVFLNEDEFAEGHDLNGTVAKAVIQSPTARESFLSNGSHVSNDGLHGVSVFVHCKLKDIPEIPSQGERIPIRRRRLRRSKCNGRRWVSIH